MSLDILTHIEEQGYPFRYSLQTNATLINKAHAELFLRHGFRIGVSLDGQQENNDVTRPFKNGNSSFAQTLSGIKLLKNSGLQVGVLVTLTRNNYQNIENIYAFFRANEIPFSIRPIFQSRFESNPVFKLSPDEYAEAFCSLFDLWFTDNDVSSGFISEMASLVAQCCEPIEGLVSCNFTKSCADRFVSLDMAGNISPCNRFYGDTELQYGNINDNSLETLVRSQIVFTLLKRWDRLSTTECAGCDVSAFCYGGCPANSRYITKDYFKKDYYCTAYKRIFRHVWHRVTSQI